MASLLVRLELYAIRMDGWRPSSATAAAGDSD
jgi:hypothetical protein